MLARNCIFAKPSITQAHSVRGSVSDGVWFYQTFCVYYTITKRVFQVVFHGF